MRSAADVAALALSCRLMALLSRPASALVAATRPSSTGSPRATAADRTGAGRPAPAAAAAPAAIPVPPNPATTMASAERGRRHRPQGRARLTAP